MERYEENKPIGAFWGWMMVFLLAAGVIGWCMFLMMMVTDPPRQWDFGAISETPAESVYSTLKAPRVHPTFPPLLRTRPSVTKDVPRQLPPLPEGVPWKPPSASGGVQTAAPTQQGTAP